MTSGHRILRFLRKMAQRFSYSTSYYNDSNSTTFVSRCKVTKKIRPSKFQYTYNFVGYKVVRLWGFEDLGVQECNAFFFLFSHRTHGTDERASGEPSLAWAIPGEEEEGEAKSRNFFWTRMKRIWRMSFFQMTIMMIALFGNKGWFVFEVLLRVHSQDTSKDNQLVIWNNLHNPFCGFCAICVTSIRENFL